MTRPVPYILSQISVKNYFTQTSPRNIFTPIVTATTYVNLIPLLKLPNPPSTSLHLPIPQKLPPICCTAYQEISSGNYDSAERLCYQSLNEEGETFECNILLAFCAFALRRYDRVIRFCQKATSIDPQRPDPYIFFGFIAYESSRIPEAIEYFRFALLLQQDSIEALIGLAKCYISINNYEAAINCLLVGIQKCPSGVPLHYELGIIFKTLSKYTEARKCFEKVIELKPNFAFAWLNLGYIYFACGQQWLTMHHFEKAIYADPNCLEAYLVYANMSKELRLLDRAIQIYLKALSLFSNSAQLYSGLAGVYHDCGLYDLAIESFANAIHLQPNYPDAYCNLANAYKDKGMVGEAEYFYKMAIQYCPSHCDSYNNLANIYREQGRFSDCFQFYQKALEISPDFAAAHSNIATVYQQFGNTKLSLYHYQRAINSNPNQSETYSLLGNVYKDMGSLKTALECYARAIQLNPISADAHAQIAAIYKDIGNTLDAINSFKIAFKLKPDYHDVYSNLIHCYLMICDWNEYDIRISKIVRIVEEQLANNRPPSIHPHHTMLYPLLPSQRKAIAASHANFCLDRVKFLGQIRPYAYFGLQNSRLKIGYVSSDFCNHPTSHLIQSVPGSHDRSRFEVFCFSLSGNDESSFRRKIERDVEHFIDISNITILSEISDLINRLGIHILLNLNGYTKGAKNEIFALRPAPVQAMYLGYPGTSGAQYMDYIITDKITSPPQHVDYYSEKLAYMPNSFFIGDHANMFPHLLYSHVTDSMINEISQVFPSNTFPCDDESDLHSIKDNDSLNNYIEFHIKKRMEECKDCKDVGELIPNQLSWQISRSTYGIPDDSFVYCNFNQLYKMDPSIVSCWCRILNCTPNSVLWLLRFPRAGEQNIRNFAQSLDLAPNRIIFTDVANKEQHVRRGQLVDVCLDTPLCSGHTTGMDVLWAGCPIITMPGNSFASRVGASIMTAIKCEELIVDSIEEYEKLAIRLYNDPDYYKRVKKKIWFNRMSSSLFNVKEYVKDFDNLLWEMWKKHQNDPDERIINSINL